MSKTTTSRLVGRALAGLLLCYGVSLLAGCAAYDAAKYAVTGATQDSLLDAGGKYTASLCDMVPVLSEGWLVRPQATDVSITCGEYSSALKAAVDGDKATTARNRYHLGGLYSALGLVLGVTNDEPDEPSWTAFRFWGDGREIALPHYVKKGERRTVFVDVRGVDNLDLIAEGIPQTDGKTYGATSVGWGATTLVREDTAVYLADLVPTKSSNWVQAPHGGEIWINWRPYPHSVLGTVERQATQASSCTYSLGGKYKTLLACVGVDHATTEDTTGVVFEAYGDGVRLAGPDLVTRSLEQLLRLEVSGVNELELRAKVSSGGTNKTVDVGWGMAMLLRP